MVVTWSRTFAPGYGNLTFGVAEFEEIKNLSILGVTLDSKLTCETHLRKVVVYLRVDVVYGVSFRFSG